MTTLDQHMTYSLCFHGVNYPSKTRTSSHDTPTVVGRLAHGSAAHACTRSLHQLTIAQWLRQLPKAFAKASAQALLRRKLLLFRISVDSFAVHDHPAT